MIGWLLVGLTLVAGYGWAVRLLHEQSWLTALLGLARSTLEHSHWLCCGKD
jgi:hypothetical protein